MNINYQSDFKIIERLMPDAPFRFTYYVAKDKGSVTAEYDGQSYSGCFVDGERLIVPVDGGTLGIGSVRVKREYFLDDKAFADGVCNLVSVEGTDIELGRGRTDSDIEADVEVGVYYKTFTFDDMTEEQKQEIADRVPTNEAEREKAEAQRVEAENVRVEAEKGREAAEAARQATFTANEESRQSTFDTNEAEREAEFNAAIQSAKDNLIVVNDLTTGGADKALSAEMGKRINSQLNGETSITVVGAVADLSNLYINIVGTITGTSRENRHVCKYPIAADKQYSLHIPQAGNEYCLMYGFSNTPDLAALEPSANGEKTAEAFPEVGDNGEHTLEIDTTGKDYQYLVVCYDISGGSPTLTTMTEAGGLLNEVEELQNKVSALENEDVVIDRSKPSIYLSPDIYILNDRTTQLFYRGLVRAVTPYIYDIKVMCSIGKTFPRYYEINTPPVGEYPLRIQLRDDELKVLAEAETTIHVVAAPSSLPSKNILCVGASATATGHWPAELKRLMNDGTSPAGLGYSMDFVGRKVGSSDKTIHLEATGGWSWNTFITPSMKTVRFYISHLDGELAMDDKLTFGNATFTVIEINLTEGVGNIRCAGENNWTAASTPSIQSGTMTSAKGTELNVTSWTEENYAPFYNNTSGKIDFKSYADQYCDGELDVLVCHLGVNSALNEGTSPDTAISHAKNFIDGYLADFPNGKVVVSGIPMPDDGTNVYSNKYAEKNINRYGTLVSFLEYNKALRNLVSEYGSNVVWASSDIFFDTDYGYPKKDKDVNTRISDYKELIGTNGIHPVAKGSYMIADGILPTIIDLLV